MTIKYCFASDGGERTPQRLFCVSMYVKKTINERFERLKIFHDESIGQPIFVVKMGFSYLVMTTMTMLMTIWLYLRTVDRMGLYGVDAKVLYHWFIDWYAIEWKNLAIDSRSNWLLFQSPTTLFYHLEIDDWSNFALKKNDVVLRTILLLR